MHALQAGLRQQTRTSTTYIGILQAPSPTAVPQAHLHCQDCAIDSHAKVKPQAYMMKRPTRKPPPATAPASPTWDTAGPACELPMPPHLSHAAADSSTRLPGLAAATPHRPCRACMRAPTALLLARCAARCSAAGGLVGCHAAPLTGPHSGAPSTAGHWLAGHPVVVQGTGQQQGEEKGGSRGPDEGQPCSIGAMNAHACVQSASGVLSGVA
jgi:hypothetical protein